MGAPIANRNAVRHGLRTGKLPPGCGYVAALTNEFRASLEEEVLSRYRNIGVYRAAVINSACRWERHALLCLRWLRKESGNMTAEQRLVYSLEIAKASEKRDVCLSKLGLGRPTRADMFGELVYDMTAESDTQVSEETGGEYAVLSRDVPEYL